MRKKESKIKKARSTTKPRSKSHATNKLTKREKEMFHNLLNSNDYLATQLQTLEEENTELIEEIHSYECLFFKLVERSQLSVSGVLSQ